MNDIQEPTNREDFTNVSGTDDNLELRHIGETLQTDLMVIELSHVNADTEQDNPTLAKIEEYDSNPPGSKSLLLYTRTPGDKLRFQFHNPWKRVTFKVRYEWANEPGIFIFYNEEGKRFKVLPLEDTPNEFQLFDSNNPEQESVSSVVYIGVTDNYCRFVDFEFFDSH